MVKLQTSLSKIVAAMGDRVAPQTTTSRDSPTPDADTPIESTEIHEEVSLEQETSQLSLAETAEEVDEEDLREESYDEDDATALMNQLNAEAERAEESILLDDRVLDESRETSVLSIRAKRQTKSISQQPARQSSSRERDSLVNELLSDDSEEETL